MSLVYIVVVASLFGYGSWAWLMKHHAASKVVPFTLLVPVFGIAAAWIALGERPGALEIVGAVVVIGGLGSVSVTLGRRTAIPGGRRVTPPRLAD